MEPCKKASFSFCNISLCFSISISKPIRRSFLSRLSSPVSSVLLRKYLSIWSVNLVFSLVGLKRSVVCDLFRKFYLSWIRVCNFEQLVWLVAKHSYIKLTIVLRSMFTWKSLKVLKTGLSIWSVIFSYSENNKRRLK